MQLYISGGSYLSWIFHSLPRWLTVLCLTTERWGLDLLDSSLALIYYLPFFNSAGKTWWKDHQNRIWATDSKSAEEGLWAVLLQSTGAHFYPHCSEADFEYHWEWTDGKHPEGRAWGGAGQGSVGWVKVEI